jgi:hypothetical protein
MIKQWREVVFCIFQPGVKYNFAGVQYRHRRFFLLLICVYHFLQSSRRAPFCVYHFLQSSRQVPFCVHQFLQSSSRTDDCKMLGCVRNTAQLSVCVYPLFVPAGPYSSSVSLVIAILPA